MIPARTALTTAQGLVDIAGPDGGGEAEGGVVGDAEGVLFVFKGDDGGDGAEDLFAGDAGGVVDVVEDGWLDVVAVVEAFGAVASDGGLGFGLT